LPIETSTSSNISSADWALLHHIDRPSGVVGRLLHVVLVVSHQSIVVMTTLRWRLIHGLTSALK
jgi:hypothetical protein